MQPDERQWTLFYRELARSSGIDLSLYRQEQTRRRILAMAKTEGASDLLEFGTRIAREPDGVSRLMAHLAINVTSMFRNEEKWRVLEQKVLPELLRRSPALTVWSAGCSHGSEPYSLAALLHERWPGLHRIIATDVDHGALEHARAGLFKQADVDAMPRDSLRALFEPHPAGFRANHSLRRMVSVAHHNLLAQAIPGRFDLILCRNVTIYFNEQAKAALYRRFFAALRPGGYLLVGNTERIFDCREIGFENPLTCIYHRPEGGADLWRNAS